MQNIALFLGNALRGSENMPKSSSYLSDATSCSMAWNLPNTKFMMENENANSLKKSINYPGVNRKNTDFEAVFLPLDNRVAFDELMEKGRRLVEDGKCVLLVPFFQRESGNPMM